MPIKKELVIVLPNRAGTLAAVAKALANANVSFLAVDAAGGFEHNVVRFVPDNAAKAKAVLKRRSFDVGESNVLCVYVDDRRGVLAKVTGKLGRAKVNIDYLYGTGSSSHGKELIVIHTNDPKKAAKVLA
jgi:hypothetical protein